MNMFPSINQAVLQDALPPVLSSSLPMPSLTTLGAHAPPLGFPASGNGLWYVTPGDVWSRTWLPVGNGYLGGTSLD
jgi:hypothetical protein